MTLNASVTTTATATAGAMAPIALGAIVRPNQKKKIAANMSRSGTMQPLDARPDPGAGHDHAGQQRADGVRRARDVGEAGDEHAEADAEDDRELGVGGREDGRTRRAPQRASANSPIRNANAVATERTTSPAASCSPRIGCRSAR